MHNPMYEEEFDEFEEKHECCWHFISGYTQGDGRAGADDERCCHCGLTRFNRKWRAGAPQGHGSYSPNITKIYDD